MRTIRLPGEIQENLYRGFARINADQKIADIARQRRHRTTSGKPILIATGAKIATESGKTAWSIEPLAISTRP